MRKIQDLSIMEITMKIVKYEFTYLYYDYVRY